MASQDSSSWFDDAGAGTTLAAGKKRPSAAAVDAFRERGAKALADATAKYASSRQAEGDGDTRFMDQMIKSGTVSDQVAAMTLRVQSSPMHKLGMLDALLKLCARGNHRGARLALEALVDLFKTNLLPADRPLIPLEARPIQGDGKGGWLGARRRRRLQTTKCRCEH